MTVDRSSRRVRRMFASIAPRYDLLNRLLSANVDQRWRRLTCQSVLAVAPDELPVLDLCTGTGDLALPLARERPVVGCDFCYPMLEIGRRKAGRRVPAARPDFVASDTLRLPFQTASKGAVTVAFGLRNLSDYAGGLREMARVLVNGGVLAVLEFSIPTRPGLRQLYLFYFTRVLPIIGRLVSGRDGPYSYLPQSVREFPSPAELSRIMEQAGFEDVTTRSLTGGIATLYLARRA